MAYIKFLYKKESENHDRDDIDDLLILKNDRDIQSSGLFTNAGYQGQMEHNSEVPFRLISYTTRVWTTSPSLLWSTEAGNLEHSQPGFNTGLETENVANGINKKFTLTDQGRNWAILHHRFCGTKPVWSKRMKKWVGKKWGKARRMNDCIFKIQLQNVDPRASKPTQAYYAFTTVEVEYDAV